MKFFLYLLNASYFLSILLFSPHSCFFSQNVCQPTLPPSAHPQCADTCRYLLAPFIKREKTEFIPDLIACYLVQLDEQFFVEIFLGWWLSPYPRIMVTCNCCHQTVCS